jgi:hypothetical protein
MTHALQTSVHPLLLCSVFLAPSFLHAASIFAEHPILGQCNSTHVQTISHTFIPLFPLSGFFYFSFAFWCICIRCLVSHILFSIRFLWLEDIFPFRWIHKVIVEENFSSFCFYHFLSSYTFYCRNNKWKIHFPHISTIKLFWLLWFAKFALCVPKFFYLFLFIDSENVTLSIKVNPDALWWKLHALLHTGICFVRDRCFTVPANMEITGGDLYHLYSPVLRQPFRLWRFLAQPHSGKLVAFDSHECDNVVWCVKLCTLQMPLRRK